MNFYRRFPGDYAADAGHLNMIEDGAYQRLLDRSYLTEKPLTLKREDLYRQVRAMTNEEQWAIDRVLTEFFIETKRGWIHKRVLREIERANHISEQCSVNGRKGGVKRQAEAKPRPSSPESQGQACQTLDSKTLDSRLQTLEKEKATTKPLPEKTSGFSLPEDFVRFWAVYPKHEDKREALGKWLSLSLQDRLAAYAGVARWKQSGRWDDPQFAPSPARYLRRRKWEDEVAQADGPRTTGEIKREITDRATSEVFGVSRALDDPAKRALQRGDSSGGAIDISGRPRGLLSGAN